MHAHAAQATVPYSQGLTLATSTSARQAAAWPQQPQQQQQPLAARGWGGESLPQQGRAGGRSRGDNWGRGRGSGGNGGRERQGQQSGRGRRGHSRGRGDSCGHSALGAAGTEALIHQLLLAIRHRPQDQTVADATASSLHLLDDRAVSSLVKLLANNGLSQAAWELFNWLRRQDDSSPLRALCGVYLYTAMVSLCAQSSSQQDFDTAMALSAEMQARGVQRNVHTFSALMNVAIKAGQNQAALSLWRELQAEGCQPNVVAYNTLLDAMGKTGQWAEALRLLERMRAEGHMPVTRTYNTLMIACNSSNQWQEALGVYSQMVAANVPANTTTYNALITAYSKGGRMDKVLDTYRLMVTAGCERTVITYSALISACEKEANWELALQMYGQMLQERLTPNIITFNSLIMALAAGGQWERAAELFSQLQRQGCQPDVVTYTGLINAYEKGGQWRRALQAFERMQQHCHPDHVVYTAIIDTLWDSGVVMAQERAGRLYRTARASGLHKSPASHQGDTLEVQLGPGANGFTIVSFLCFLADSRQQAIHDGADSLPPKVVLRFARARGREAPAGAPMLRELLQAWLQMHRSPFALLLDGATGSRLEAAAPAVTGWLLGDEMALVLLRYSSGAQGGGDSARLAADLSHDASLEVRCVETFAAVRHFEQTHCLSLSAMGPDYLARRRELVARILQVGAALQLAPEIVHDAILLLDRVMSAPLQLPSDLHVVASITALKIAASNEAPGGGLLGGSVGTTSADTHLAPRLAEAAGLPLVGIRSMAMNFQSVLSNDLSAVCTVRCVKLYMQRLGLLAAEAHADIGAAPISPMLMGLLQEAALDTEFLNYRPSVITAAAMYCERLQQGTLPLWPAALALLTGYRDLSQPELAAAINGMQRLSLQLPTLRHSPGGAGGGMHQLLGSLAGGGGGAGRLSN